MKLLISAFACSPYQGSEPGVGWTAVTRIARKHDVWVLTNMLHKQDWDRAASMGVIPPNIRVRFLKCGGAFSENRAYARLQSWFHYASFNSRVLDAAKAWHEEVGFDLCHQVTIAAWRMPSPLWRLPIPFIWGPIGGAGHIPRTFRPMLSPAARIFELVRDLNTWFARRKKDFRDCVRETAVIFAANQETMTFLKPLRGDRPLVQLPIASFPEEAVARFRRPDRDIPSEIPLQLFAGGNMEGRKGVALALKALAMVKQSGVGFHYTIAGGGPDIPFLKKLTNTLGIADQVEFNYGYQGDAYVEALWSSDIYLLPSFRESTPVTLLEACLAGCYPVVADTSAQGEIARLVGGSSVPVQSMNDLIQGLADAIVWCARHQNELPSLSESIAAKVADHFSSERYDATLEEAYRLALGA